MEAIVVGGGIAGLTAALCLHAKGINVEVFERTPEIRELGVGVNILPHATKVLDRLGLVDKLYEVGIETAELIFCHRLGQTIWQEPRGRDAGYRYPQFSIHRGRLQGVLYEEVKARIGADHVHAGHELTHVTQTDGQVTATMRLANGTTVERRADVAIGADGIHSNTRAAFYPGEGPPIWSGRMFWRGAAEWDPFLTGRSMIISGGMTGKLVVYPISNQGCRPGKTLMNWAVFIPAGEPGSEPPRRENWDRRGDTNELLPFVKRTFRSDVVDVVGLISATEEIFEYPVCDRDPIDRWSFGRATMIGDAAHPMYPMGSNGASQAIIDAGEVADWLSRGLPAAEALSGFQKERIPQIAQIVRSNREGGNERVIDVVAALAPDGFTELEDVISQAQLAKIVTGYSVMAGFSKEAVNG